MEFSISATSRAPRGNEKNGVEYYFISTAEFKNRISNNEFVEYEEVYPGCFYGTLRAEVERITSAGSNVVFDVDVKGKREENATPGVQKRNPGGSTCDFLGELKGSPAGEFLGSPKVFCFIFLG